MPPVEQPARTTATARSAAARARLGTGRCDRDVNIMPVQAPRRIATPPRRPASPLRGKIAANSSNGKQAVVPQYDQSKVKGTALRATLGRGSAASRAKAHDASRRGYE